MPRKICKTCQEYRVKKGMCRKSGKAKRKKDACDSWLNWGLTGRG